MIDFKQEEIAHELYRVMDLVANDENGGDKFLMEEINNWFNAKMDGMYQVQEVTRDNGRQNDF